MKKKQLNRLAILGIASGLLTSQVEATADQAGVTMSPEQIRQLLAAHKCKGPSGCAGLVAERDVPDSSSWMDQNNANLSNSPITETELLLELSPEDKATYKNLSPEAKKLVLHVASQKLADKRAGAASENE